MTIETKFEIGDEVWLQRQGKIINTKIIAKRDEYYVLEEIDRTLMLGFDANMLSQESKLFKSKEELLKSL